MPACLPPGMLDVHLSSGRRCPSGVPITLATAGLASGRSPFTTSPSGRHKMANTYLETAFNVPVTADEAALLEECFETATEISAGYASIPQEEFEAAKPSMHPAAVCSGLPSQRRRATTILS
jgi:hypothetical protein